MLGVRLGAAVQTVDVGANGIHVLILHQLADKAQVPLQGSTGSVSGCFFERLAQFFGHLELLQLGWFELNQTTTQISHFLQLAFDLSFADAFFVLFVVVKLCHGHLVAARLRVGFNAP